MTALKVVGVILLVLFLIGLIRVGGEAEYSAEGVKIWIRAAGVPILVFPRTTAQKKGEKKSKKGESKPKSRGKKSPDEDQNEGKKPTKGGPLGLVKTFLPLVGEAAGALKRRIRIDILCLDYTAAGGRDAAKTAMTFGYANAAIGMIWPIFEHNFEIKDYRIHTGLDFQAKEPAIYVKGAFSARIGQLVSFAVIFGVKFLKAYFGYKNAQKLKG